MQSGGTLAADALGAPFRTRRLLLRRPVPADLAAIARLIHDPVIARNTGLIRYPYPVISGRRWIADARRAESPALQVTYLLTLRSNPRLIAGAAGINAKPGREPTIGYWIAKPYRRRGFASEAARALLDLAFSSSDLPAVGASALTTNPASQRVLQRTGMSRIGLGRIRSAQFGRYMPVIRFRIDRKSWENRPARALKSV